MAVLLLLLSVVVIVFMTAKLKVHPFFVLILVSLMYGLLVGMPVNVIIESIQEGFGNTLGSIGLLIILGVAIGSFLEHSGGAFALAEKVLKIIGKKRVPTAMGIVGYFVSIPVFADSGFILLSPINKSLSKKAGISLAGSAIALGMGLVATHTMVPPTPGPIAAAGILGADLGIVLGLGLIVSALALVVGLLYATKYAARTYIDPEPDISDAEIELRLKEAPSAFKSSLPVLIPIILILLKSFVESLGGSNDSNGMVRFVLFVGTPFMALLIGLFLALLLPKKLEKNMLSTTGWMGKALTDASTIVLITGAGGVFGKVLQNSDIATQLGDTLANAKLGIWLPFLLAAAIKTAQGSSTVSLITTAGIMSPMMETLGFVSEVEKAFVVLAIGAGSAVVSHANDSFFWVLSQLCGMDVKTAYRIHTLGTFVIGTSAAVFIFIGYIIFT